MPEKGLTRKQLITWLESEVRNDNVCITEGDMRRLFHNAGDTYMSSIQNDEVVFNLVMENDYWHRLRPFLPRKGDVLKDINK